MNTKLLRRLRKSKGGFTLIELLVVVLIIGILAAIAVPQYFKVVEKGKAAESLTTLDSIRSAQERYLAASGAYCSDKTFVSCNGWDMPVPSMKYFDFTSLAATTAPTWTAVLTRNGSPAGYGAYTVTYKVASGQPPSITCSNTSCQNDLMPQ